jgi:hypothetical protein
MHGNSSASAPTRYGVLIPVMEKMGWSWADLCGAPADLVDEIATRIQAERHWTAERARMDEQLQRTRQELGANRG